jgi:signal peptidase I
MEQQHEENFFKEIFKFSLIALLIVLPIRFFIAQPFIVNGASMQPTFENGQYLIVDQLSYYFEKPQRSDVIIFHYPLDPSKFFIKRVIGLPGETVEISGTTITITNDALPGGFPLEEPYLEEANLKTDFLTVTLGESEYFVLGDNRSASSDSRVWGALPEKNIVGRPFLRLFPLNELSILPN